MLLQQAFIWDWKLPYLQCSYSSFGPRNERSLQHDLFCLITHFRQLKVLRLLWCLIRLIFVVYSYLIRQCNSQLMLVSNDTSLCASMKSAFICVSVCVHVCVCACERERERPCACVFFPLFGIVIFFVCRITEGEPVLLQESVLQTIGTKYGKSPAQVSWLHFSFHPRNFYGLWRKRGLLCSVWRERCAVFKYEERGVLFSGMKRERCAVFRYEERGVLCSDMKREVCFVQVWRERCVVMC